MKNNYRYDFCWKFIKTYYTMMNRIKYLGALVLFLIVFSGCNRNGAWEEQERSQIESYIQTLGDTAYILKPSGLYYIELQAGTGRAVVAKDTVSFWYRGMFLDGFVFDQNFANTEPYSAIVGNHQVIKGIDEGFLYMKEGGKTRFLTPSSLAYGQSGYGGIIPGFTPIIWEITMVKVRPGSK
jgi:peptidyl-prolyl cis-trans isomerase A (cyclophilin A)